MQASPDDIDIGQLWQAVKRSGLRLAVAALAAGLVTYAVLASMAPLYRSSAQIILSRDASVYSRPRAEQQPTAESLKIDQDEISSQVEVIQSADALQRIITDLKLEKRPEFNSALRGAGPITGVLRLVGLVDGDRKLPERERVFNAFRKNLVVYSVAKSHVIAIDFTSTDPKLSADISNAVAAAYIENNRLDEVRRDTDATSWIGSRIDALKADAESAESALERFRAQAGLLAGQNNVTLNTQQLSELNTQLTASRTQRSEAETRAAEVRQMLVAGDVEASPDVLRSPVIQRLLEQKGATEREFAELSATLLAKHPRMLQVSSKLAKIKVELRREAAKIVRSLETEAQIAGSRVSALEASMNELTTRAEQSSDAQAKLGGLERAAKSKRELYEAYLDRFNEARTRDQRAVASYARLISRAMPSNIAAFPKKVPSALLAMVGMGLAGLGLVVTRELMRAARGGRRTPAPVRAIATAGAVAGRRRPASGTAPVVEEARLGDIAQILIRRIVASSGAVTLVTAAHQAEVARTALKLATAVSQSGRTVVVVDAGVDKPGLAAVAAVRAAPGWHELLGGQATFEDVLVTASEGGVHLIPAGASAMPKDALGEPTRLCIEALAEIYELVLVLASPSRFKAMLGSLDNAVEIVVGDDDDTIVSQLAAASVQVFRYRPEITVPDRLRSRLARTAPAPASTP